MTPAIVHYMVQMERTWDRHRAATFDRRDLTAVLADLVAEPAVQHLPGRTGGTGAEAFRRFYAEDLLPHLPDDIAFTRESRTVDRFRLVDESTVSFTHDRELPWLLPGVEPTHRPVAVSVVAIVGYERGKISWLRHHWDHATLAQALGLPTLLPA